MDPFHSGAKPNPEYPKHEDAKLGQLDDANYYYAAQCADCRYRVRLSLNRLRKQLGDDFQLVSLRSRLKCKECGSKDHCQLLQSKPQNRITVQVLQRDAYMMNAETLITGLKTPMVNNCVPPHHMRVANLYIAGNKVLHIDPVC